ncbi:MAG: maturase [Actinomycetota bacterium]|nr:maturase [Actinomycetota bacterium]MDA8356597.1 maturase [Actinomycetota bacterium]
MSGDVHVRFCESRGVRFPPATHLVVLCPTEERAIQARDLAAATLATLGLHLHPEKTRIICLRQGEEGFDLLGFHHRMMRSWRFPDRYYLHKWPSDRAMASIRAKVKERTPRRYASIDLRYVVENLNPVLRGWGAYFRVGNSSRKFATIDSYVHERLAMLASVKRGLTGRRWTTRFTYRWFTSLGVHRLSGTVRYGTAHALR